MRKVCLTILLIMVMMLLSFTVVNAAEDEVRATFKLTTTNTNVKVGDIVEVNLVIDELVGLNGVDYFVATKKFDSTVFEYLGVNEEKMDTYGWSSSGPITAKRVQFEINNPGEYTPSGTIAVLKFKVLKPVDNATISLVELDISGDTAWPTYEDGNVNQPSISFKITEEQTPEEPGDDTNTVPDTNTNTTPDTNTVPDTNTNKVPDTNTNKVNNDKTTAPGGQIPQTGESYTIVALVAFVVVLAGIFYSKYKMYEEK